MCVSPGCSLPESWAPPSSKQASILVIWQMGTLGSRRLNDTQGHTEPGPGCIAVGTSHTALCTKNPPLQPYTPKHQRSATGSFISARAYHSFHPPHPLQGGICPLPLVLLPLPWPGQHRLSPGPPSPCLPLCCAPAQPSHSS